MSSIDGVKGFRRIMRQLPDEVRTEIIGALGRAGQRLQAAMRARARRGKTGDLQAGIKYKVLPRSLRMQVGILGTKRERRALFYGFVLDKGRKAQTVTVHRRRRGAPKILSRGRKRAQDIASVYQLRVTRLKADHFVTGRFPDLRASISQEIRTLFQRALRRIGGSS